MAVTRRLARFGYARPHVFVATVPGGYGARLGVERFTREQGWPVAASPADTDILAVCGEPGTDWVADAVELLWRQVPAPRARVHLASATDVGTALGRARAELYDAPAQRAAAPGAALEPALEPADDGELAGLPMAGRAPDRDGLALDQIEVAIGPFLPGWPVGWRLRVTLQGDVAAAAGVEHVPAHTERFAGSPAAGRLDALAALLDVCGADGWAVAARRLRDELLAGADRSHAVARFARRLRRSRLLRACTDGVATVDGRDATARWRSWLDEAEQVRAGDPGPLLAAVGPRELGAAVVGHELGGLRIAVASLVPPTGFTGVREPVVT